MSKKSIEEDNSSVPVILGAMVWIIGLGYIGVRLKWGPPFAPGTFHDIAPGVFGIGCIWAAIIFLVGLLELNQGPSRGGAADLLGCTGGLLILSVTLPITLTGFPGFSRNWQSAWWIRLLDVLANLVWLLALILVVAVWEGAPRATWPTWSDLGKAWMFIAIPSAIMSAIRWAVIFIVRGANAKPAPESNQQNPEPPPHRPSGQAQFLPALSKRSNPSSSTVS